MKDQISTSEYWQLPQESTRFPPGQQQPPADSSIRPPILHTFLVCVSLLQLWLSFHPPWKRCYFGCRLQQSLRNISSTHAFAFNTQTLPLWWDKFSKEGQARGRITKSFGLEQDQETQVKALPYKKYKGVLRDSGLQFLIRLKDSTLGCKDPVSMQ